MSRQILEGTAKIFRCNTEVDFAELTYQHHLANFMRTSVKKLEDHYTVADLPTFGLDDSKVARIA